ncbi:HET-domain-containing protein, partial [Lophiostoma macrostomum CBS 122681]
MKCNASPFQPLDKTSRQIRILILHPGDGDQGLSCDHEIVSLDRPGGYEALSYCWGPPDTSAEIMLNGAHYHVSSALKAALNHLRWMKQPRRLWIDALCIEQGQKEEKLHQVAQMRSVYESASQVLVWIGTPTKDTVAGMELINRIATSSSRYYSRANGFTLSDVPMSLDSLVGILAILRRPYWYRMWIIQEVAVASRPPLIGCGSMWLSWDIFHI